MISSSDADGEVSARREIGASRNANVAMNLNLGDMDANSARGGAMLARAQQHQTKSAHMNVGSIFSSPLLTLNSATSGGSSGISGFLPTQNSTAKTAASATILPSTNPVQMSPEMLLMLQGDRSNAEAAQATPASIEQPSVEDQFLAEAHKTPMQRMREQILKALGVTEEQLAQMSPEERSAMEDRVREMIEEKIREAHNAGNGPPDSNTEMLQSLA